jgi:hypothetical protein
VIENAELDDDGPPTGIQVINLPYEVQGLLRGLRASFFSSIRVTLETMNNAPAHSSLNILVAFYLLHIERCLGLMGYE